MKKFATLALAALLSSAAMAQVHGNVVDAKCTETTKESLVGAGVGAAAGAAGTKMMMGLLGFSSKTANIAALAGAAAGGSIGNSMAAKKEYSCTVVVKTEKDFVIHTGTYSNTLTVGAPVQVYKAADGSTFIQAAVQ